jgi:hypothetical protein
MLPRYGTGVQFCTESICVRTSRVLGIFLYIYLIDENLNYYQNNSRLSVDVGKLPNHVKSVSQLSLDLSLFDSILFIIIVRSYNSSYISNLLDNFQILFFIMSNHKQKF